MGDTLVRDLINSERSLVEVVSPDEEISTHYGIDVYAVTLEQIEALKNGNAFYLDIEDGEYSALIHLQVKGET